MPINMVKTPNKGIYLIKLYLSVVSESFSSTESREKCSIHVDG